MPEGTGSGENREVTIRFAGRLDEALHHRAQRLALRGALPLWLVYALVGLALAAGSVLAFLGGLLVAGALVFSLGVLGSLAITLYEVVVRRGREAHRLAREPFEGSLDDDALRIGGPGGRAGIPWDRFQRWKAGRGLLLLFESSRLFHVLAPEFFATPEDWRAARDLVAEKVPSGQEADRRRLLWTFLLWFAVFFTGLLLWQAFRGG